VTAPTVRVTGEGAPATSRLGLIDSWHQRELFWTLVERQLRLRRKRSVMGVAWPLISPLFLLALYGVVFTSVFKVPVADYPIYLFAGLLPWSFLVQAVHDSLQAISFEPDLIRRAPFPPHFLPLARVVVMIFPFLALLAGFVAYELAFTEVPVSVALLPWLVVPIGSLFLFVAAASLLLSLFDVFNRDLRYLLQNLLTVWFFLIPIVYHRGMVEGTLRIVTRLDPMRLIIDQFRDVLYEGRVDDPGVHLLTLAGCLVAFVVALAVFRAKAVDLAKDV